MLNEHNAANNNLLPTLMRTKCLHTNSRVMAPSQHQTNCMRDQRHATAKRALNKSNLFAQKTTTQRNKNIRCLASKAALSSCSFFCCSLNCRWPSTSALRSASNARRSSSKRAYQCNIKRDERPNQSDKSGERIAITRNNTQARDIMKTLHTNDRKNVCSNDIQTRQRTSVHLNQEMIGANDYGQHHPTVETCTTQAKAITLEGVPDNSDISQH